jgi:tRNA dimethylallyltransferase
VRALEVFRLTGQPISHQQTQFDEGTPAEQCKVFVLAWPRAELHQRIEGRVDRMFASGLVHEVRQLLDVYGSLSRTALQAVGYREVMDHLQGQRDLADTIDLVKTRTRQFARRQVTWFRSLQECRWVAQDASSNASEAADRIVHMTAAAGD